MNFFFCFWLFIFIYFLDGVSALNVLCIVIYHTYRIHYMVFVFNTDADSTHISYRKGKTQIAFFLLSVITASVCQNIEFQRKGFVVTNKACL